MEEFERLELLYRQALAEMVHLPKEALLEVNLPLLDQLGVTDSDDFTSSLHGVTRTFQVVEGEDKITLYNTKYIIWIVPKLQEGIPATYALVAFNQEEKPLLEMVFFARGVYNSSRLILRVLEKLLVDMEENEEAILGLK